MTVNRLRVLRQDVRYEQDVVTARQRARLIAAAVGFDLHEQTRISTAVSEIVRNAFRYAGGGSILFEVTADAPQALLITVSDRGQGIRDVDLVLSGRYVSHTGMGMGLLGARRLMDGFELTTGDTGTTVVLRKRIPAGRTVTGPEVARIGEEMHRRAAGSPVEELQEQNQELLRAMEEIQRRQAEIERLNEELKETNRGVLALNAELEDKAESLRLASETKSRFLSHMSHEFRTPLNSIRSLAGILSSRMDGPLTTEQEKQVLLIRNSADVLFEMVNDLLDLAKIESGKLDAQVTTFSLAELFGTMRGMFRPLLLDGRVELVVADPAGIPPMQTDETKLAQIIRNLIANAVKYTEQGRIEVSAERVDRDLVRIRVTDTGIGIAEEHLASIFEEFIQVPNALQKRAKGTGLGLPLSRRLAQLLGGDIEVRSRPGEGSEFSVTIPRVLAEPENLPAVSADAPVLPRILIVDDREADRYALRVLLPRDTDIIEAHDGEQALTMIRGYRPSLVFLDLGLPDMTGVDVLESLAKDGQRPPSPIIVHTSQVLSESDRRKLGDLGVSGVVQKGYSDVDAAREEVARVMRAALGGGAS